MKYLIYSLFILYCLILSSCAASNTERIFYAESSIQVRNCLTVLNRLDFSLSGIDTFVVKKENVDTVFVIKYWEK